MDIAELENLSLNYMERIKLGDRVAFQGFYHFSRGYLYRLILRILNNEQLAEDALQESYVRIWHKAREFNASKGSCWGWVCQVARNIAIDVRRREQRHDDTVEIDDSQLESAFVTEMEEQDRSVLSRCLQALKEMQRTCIVKAFSLGMSHDEVSQDIGVPLGTVKSHIRRGLKELKLCLD